MSAYADRGRPAPPADPDAAVERLVTDVPEVRGAALLDDRGQVLAATGDPSRWAEPVAALLEGAREAERPEVEQIHVGTGDGEVIAVRHGGATMVAVTDRFPLASLVAFDMRRLIDELRPVGPEAGP